MIEIKGVVKKFGSRRGLDEFTLSVPRGSLFGLVGPNGAGKTTLMKLLAGLSVADRGSLLVDNKDPVEDPQGVRAVIGYQPDFAGVYQGMRVHEYLEFFADAFRLGRRKPSAIALALDRSHLADRRDDFVEELSFGWKQRLVLAKTLLHDPKVLLLDEPATGLDPIARIDLRQQLKALNAGGLTILISSHILADLEDICTHVAFISEGKNAAGTDGQSVMTLHEGQGRDYVIAWLAGKDAREVLVATAQATMISAQENSALLHIVGGDRAAAEILRSLVAAGIDVTSFSVSGEGLENRYRKVFGGKS